MHPLEALKARVLPVPQPAPASASFTHDLVSRVLVSVSAAARPHSLTHGRGAGGRARGSRRGWKWELLVEKHIKDATGMPPTDRLPRPFLTSYPLVGQKKGEPAHLKLRFHSPPTYFPPRPRQVMK